MTYPTQMKLIHEEAIYRPVTNIQRVGNIIRFEAILQEGDTANRNGRIYPSYILKQGIEDPRIKDLIKRRALWGEWGHPREIDVSRQQVTPQSNCCVVFEDMWMEGNLVKGRCATMATPAGFDLMNLILENGFIPGFSLRATGDVKKNEHRIDVVQSPLIVFTYDVVNFPSNPRALMTNLSESTQILSKQNNFLMESGQIFDLPNILHENAEIKKEILKEEIDFTKNSNKNIKKLNETYFFNEEDKVVKIEGNDVILEDTKNLKRVTREEYKSKEICNVLKKYFGK